MGRKRLLTILAAVTAAVGLQVGPAAADHCLDRGDLSLTEFLGLDDSVCVVDADGKLLQGTLEHASEPVDETVEKTTDTVEDTTDTVEETTDTVEETTEEAIDTVTGGGSPTPSDPPPAAPDPDAGGDTGGTTGGGTAGGDTASPGDRSNGDRTNSPGVSASGDARRPVVHDPARDSQLAALRAIREDLAASSWADRGVAGPVSPFGGLNDTDLDLAAPQVADSGVEPEFGERLTPEVAVASDEEDALLATSSPVTDLAEAPLALKLLASALVLGSGAVWTIASRELGKGSAGTA